MSNEQPGSGTMAGHQANIFVNHGSDLHIFMVPKSKTVNHKIHMQKFQKTRND
jgi:hypothetical protein